MRNVNFPNKSCHGMSLVELLLVMAILSVVMLAVTSLYIPAQRATVVQTQVTDVQANLRLAMNRMSRDLLTAGFLITGQPIVFDSGTDNDPRDFTIRTRIVGDGFGRVRRVFGNELELWNVNMLENFPVGTKVRLFNPVAMMEIAEESEPDPVNRVYTVGTPVTAGRIKLDNVPAGTSGEAVVVVVKDAAQPPLQSIRYRLADSDGDGASDVLLRIVNGTTQFLARNVGNVTFDYDYSPGGKVRRVSITLEGQTQEMAGTDAFAGVKTRVLQSSVTLRNVF